MFVICCRERYKKLTWETRVPDSHRLTEEDITNFVESIKPVAMQAMFSKMGLIEVSQAFQHLATLRPAIIIPQIIERLAMCSVRILTEYDFEVPVFNIMVCFQDVLEPRSADRAPQAYSSYAVHGRSGTANGARWHL
jgi:hypothetical protein